MPHFVVPKKKQKTIAALVNDAAVLMQRMVRVKAALVEGDLITCVTCGVKRHWKEMQGGHFISRRFTKYKLLEENIHPQCPACNGPLRGNYPAYTLYMCDMYGREFVDELLATKGETKKYNRCEIIDLIDELRVELKRLEGRLI